MCGGICYALINNISISLKFFFVISVMDRVECGTLLKRIVPDNPR